jgi:hypothetical protein
MPGKFNQATENLLGINCRLSTSYFSNSWQEKGSILQPDYSIKYISNPFNHLRGLGYTYGEWEVWDITPKHLSGGNKAVRYTKLEIEMPQWLDQLAQEHPAPGSTPVAPSLVEASRVRPAPVQIPSKTVNKEPRGLLAKFGNLFSRK